MINQKVFKIYFAHQSSSIDNNYKQQFILRNIHQFQLKLECIICMILIKTITNFHIIPKQLKLSQLFLPTQIISFSTINKQINNQLHHFANNVNPNLITEDFSHVANNYLKLEEQSFADYAKSTKNDPQMMLMFLSTFQSSQKIAQHLPLLYPHIDFFQSKQLLLLMQKILAFRPPTKPKVPFPKPLQQIQSILVIMSEIFIADTLIQWLKLVPIYTGKQHYILLMGYFSILQKMSHEQKNRNKHLLIKCHQKIYNIIQNGQQSLQIKIGILALAFQMNYGQAILLLVTTDINFKDIDIYKICLLFINIQKYQLKKIYKQQHQPQHQLNPQQKQMQKILKTYLNQMVTQIVELDFVKFMKIDLLMDMFKIIYQQKQIKGSYLSLTNKIVSCLHDNNYLKSIKQLTITELFIIIQTFEKHKINSQKSFKVLLILFSPHLHRINTQQFIRLLKCLVTYVRQCQDYLIDCRKILQKRKFQFTDKDVQNINLILRRVQILFPKPFSNK